VWVSNRTGAPNPAFQLIHYSGGPAEPYRASHYCKQFHIKCNPNAEAEAKAAGYNSWQARFTYMAGDVTYQYGRN
jgi:peptide/nickel transport system substrate-binding protein